MKSFKNHLSLVIALVSILFSFQVYKVVERVVDDYRVNLAQNYALVVMSRSALDYKTLSSQVAQIRDIEEINPDGVIKRLNAGIGKKDAQLLKVSLPKFYTVHLKSYPSPSQLKQIKKALFSFKGITKVETFENTHQRTYKMLLLFKTIVSVFSVSVLVVTILLIFKELKIWQFQHHERMSIMALFGAPTWLRSAVLFRLAIVDALIATTLSILFFLYISNDTWILEQFHNLSIDVEIFDVGHDSLVMLGMAMSISLLLAIFIVLGHKEEV